MENLLQVLANEQECGFMEWDIQFYNKILYDTVNS